MMKESESLSVMSKSLQPHGLYSPWNSPGQNTGVGSLSLPQGISPTQGLNPGVLHCGQILYQLSHKRSPRKLEWVAYPFSSIFLTQELNQCLLHCRWILYQLNYQGSPILMTVDLNFQSEDSNIPGMSGSDVCSVSSNCLLIWLVIFY